MAVRSISSICCIGAGYVGGPTCAVIAAQNPHIDVEVVDLSDERIAAWKSSTSLPIFEPGLLDVVKLGRDGLDGRAPNLRFSTNVTGAIRKADLIMIAVNTPTKVEGLGAGSASTLSFVESAARCIADAGCTTDKIVVVKSTVPCGTAESLRNMLDVLGPSNIHFEILSNPEFLAEGTAIRDLMYPDRVLIGSSQDSRALRAAESLANVFASWVPREKILTINSWTSELAKLAANCMLAQRISSINSLSALCEATGADVAELSYAVGLDTRIGSKFLRSSVGFGGSCFKKDVLSLVYIAETLHLPEVAKYWRTVVEINDYQKRRFSRHVIEKLHNTLWGKKIAVLGFAYKKDTGDTRESAAIEVVREFIPEKARVAIYDPQVRREQIYKDLQGNGVLSEGQVRESVEVCEDALSACAGASAILVLTEWDEFKADMVALQRPPCDASEMLDAREQEISSDEEEIDERRSTTTNDSGIALEEPQFAALEPNSKLSSYHSPKRMDWAEVARTMKRPRLVFDGRGIIDSERLQSLGFQVESIGKASWSQRC